MQRECRRTQDIEISEIQIIPVKPKDGLIAFASYVINNAIYVGNIAIYTSPSSPEKFRLVYPEKVLPNGKKIHCVHPINREVGELISKEITKKLKEIILRATEGEKLGGNK